MQPEPRTYTTIGGEVREVVVPLLPSGKVAKPVRIVPESATARLTRTNNEKLAGGIHPATYRALDPGHNCGTCVHHHRYEYHTRAYHKCDIHRLGESHSAASDIRVSWPACTAWAPEQKDQ